MKVALDSNLLIYLFEADSQHAAAVGRLVIQGPSLGFELSVSELVLAELLASSKLTDKTARHLYDKARQLQYDIHPIDTAVLLQSAALRRQYPSLKTPDAIHLATAMVHKRDCFVTNDNALLKLKLPTLRIMSIDDAGNLA